MTSLLMEQQQERSFTQRRLENMQERNGNQKAPVNHPEPTWRRRQNPPSLSQNPHSPDRDPLASSPSTPSRSNLSLPKRVNISTSAARALYDVVSPLSSSSRTRSPPRTRTPTRTTYHTARAPAPPSSFSLSSRSSKGSLADQSSEEIPTPGAYHTSVRPVGMNIQEWNSRQDRARERLAIVSSASVIRDAALEPPSATLPAEDDFTVDGGNIRVISRRVHAGSENNNDSLGSIPSLGEEEYIAGPSISTPLSSNHLLDEQPLQPMMLEHGSSLNGSINFDDYLPNTLPTAQIRSGSGSASGGIDPQYDILSGQAPLPRNHWNIINQRAYVMDAHAFVRSDPFEDEYDRDNDDDYIARQKFLAKAKCIVLLMAFFLMTAMMALLLVLLLPRNGSSSTPPTVNDTPVVNECDWIRLLEQCGPSANVSSTRLETIPSCLAEPYEALRKDWMPHADPNFDEPSDSCQPQNLAVYGAAVVRNHSDVSLLNRYVLLTLFVSTNGLAWKKNDGWLSAQEEEEEAGAECSWYRVTCDSDNRVVALELQVNNLEGESIPSELGLLTTLEKLQLSSSLLGGGIPTEFGALTGLTSLVMANAFLHHHIPTQIGLLTRLASLILASNSLSGTLPSEVGLLTNLVNLRLDGNSMMGELPTEIGYLTDLKYLYVSSNAFSGSLPSEIGELTLLSNLIIGINSFSGIIPDEVCDLWETGSLKQFGSIHTIFNRGMCKFETFGGTRCPSTSCCRTCQDPPL